MAIDLDGFAADVMSQAERWASLGLAWTFTPVHPNYGKALVAGSFETPSWAGDLSVWVTGESELSTMRLADGWIVNKHYELATSADLATALGEIADLVATGSAPPDAITG